MLAVYPNTLYPAYKILEFHIFSKMKNQRLQYILENLLRAFIVVATVVLGVLSINRFDFVLALIGCAIMTPLALIFPTMFHYFLMKNQQSKLRSVVDLTISIIGIILAIAVLVFTIIG